MKTSLCQIFCSSTLRRSSRLESFHWCNALATPSCRRQISRKHTFSRKAHWTDNWTHNWKNYLNKHITCINSIFGCLLLKCDTGLSLETRNSLIICRVQFQYYKHILLLLLLLLYQVWNSNIADENNCTSVKGNCWFANVFLKKTKQM